MLVRSGVAAFKLFKFKGREQSTYSKIHEKLTTFTTNSTDKLDSCGWILDLVSWTLFSKIHWSSIEQHHQVGQEDQVASKRLLLWSYRCYLYNDYLETCKFAFDINRIQNWAIMEIWSPYIKEIKASIPKIAWAQKKGELQLPPQCKMSHFSTSCCSIQK